MLALPELIEAASRSGQTQLAADALTRLAEATSIGQTGWCQGIYARCRALLGEGTDAETWYREAIDQLSRTSVRIELARAYLLYGERLRREGRRADARAQLRTAHEMFEIIGFTGGKGPRRATSSSLRASMRRFTRRSHSPYSRCARAKVGAYPGPAEMPDGVAEHGFDGVTFAQQGP